QQRPGAQALQRGEGGEPAPARRGGGVSEQGDRREPAAMQQEEQRVVAGAELRRSARPQPPLVASRERQLGEPGGADPGQRQPENHSARSSRSAKAAVKPGPRLESRRRGAGAFRDSASAN